MRGPGGGYLLAQKADTINIANIIAAVEEPVDTTRCGGKKNCGIQGNPCMTHNLWTLLNQQILDFLHSISLQQLMDNQRVKKPLISTSKSISPVLYIDSCYERQITLTTR
jgi:Rrf2 family iron-sulfur cluster assembly transcriptional regulator